MLKFMYMVLSLIHGAQYNINADAGMWSSALNCILFYPDFLAFVVFLCEDAA